MQNAGYHKFGCWLVDIVNPLGKIPMPHCIRFVETLRNIRTLSNHISKFAVHWHQLVIYKYTSSWSGSCLAWFVLFQMFIFRYLQTISEILIVLCSCNIRLDFDDTSCILIDGGARREILNSVLLSCSFPCLKSKGTITVLKHCHTEVKLVIL